MDEVRRAEFFRKGGAARELVKGKRWLLLSLWVHLNTHMKRLNPLEKLARMLLDHLEEILNYCRTKVPPGVLEAVNGNIKALLRPGRGYRDLNYLLLKAQRMAATKTQFIVLQRAA